MPSHEWVWNVETTSEYRLIHAVYRVIRSSYVEPTQVTMQWYPECKTVDERSGKQTVKPAKLVMYRANKPLAMPELDDAEKKLDSAMRRDLAYNQGALAKDPILSRVKEPDRARVLWIASREHVSKEYKCNLEEQLSRFCRSIGLDTYGH